MKIAGILFLLSAAIPAALGGHVIIVDFTRCRDPPNRPVGYVSGTNPPQYLPTTLVSDSVYQLDVTREQDIDVALYLSDDGYGSADQGESQQALYLHLLEQPDQATPSALFVSANEPLRPDWALSSATFDDTNDSTSVDPNTSVTVIYC